MVPALVHIQRCTLPEIVEAALSRCHSPTGPVVPPGSATVTATATATATAAASHVSCPHYGPLLCSCGAQVPTRTVVTLAVTGTYMPPRFLLAHVPQQAGSRFGEAGASAAVPTAGMELKLVVADLPEQQLMSRLDQMMQQHSAAANCSGHQDPPSALNSASKVEREVCVCSELLLMVPNSIPLSMILTKDQKQRLQLLYRMRSHISTEHLPKQWDQIGLSLYRYFPCKPA